MEIFGVNIVKLILFIVMMCSFISWIASWVIYKKINWTLTWITFVLAMVIVFMF
ncbi:MULTISPECIES: hypothetical protein [Staphylococcaceae]|uniref:hypothetical protein n=1 Tax=Staphylococcaceae TaxID=90964 RepID=UPI0015B5AA9E|nr:MULTISPECIES: hypothetical protein [Staphylococcaceae]